MKTEPFPFFFRMAINLVVEMNVVQRYVLFSPKRAKKVVSDSPRLVDFSIGLVNSVFSLPDGHNRRTVKSILVKKRLGLVEMMSGLVNASFSLHERQAIKIIFFAPCSIYICKFGTVLHLLRHLV